MDFLKRAKDEAEKLESKSEVYAFISIAESLKDLVRQRNQVPTPLDPVSPFEISGVIYRERLAGSTDADIARKLLEHYDIHRKGTCDQVDYNKVAVFGYDKNLRIEPEPVNWGHGHVYPRIDGVKARCGGPGLCSECARDAGRLHNDREKLK